MRARKRDSEFFSKRESSDGLVCAYLRDGLLFIRVAGEPGAAYVLECIREAVEAGWMVPSMRTVVDIRDYRGAIDWTMIRSIRELAPWGEDRPQESRVAYLVRNQLFAGLVRITAAFFAMSQHRAFTRERNAIRWVLSSEPGGFAA